MKNKRNVCYFCNGSGYLNDSDSEQLRFGVCLCFGTGVEIERSLIRSKISALRFFRYANEQALGKFLSCQDGTLDFAKAAKEIERLQKILNAKILPQELELLFYARHFWEKVGKPHGVYAEDLVKILEKEFLPMIPNREISDEELARFSFDQKELSENLNGLTPNILADLYDIVSKFGTRIPDLQIIEMKFSAFELAVSASMNNGNHCLHIFEHGKDTARIFLSYGNGHHAIISPEISTDMLIAAIKVFDWALIFDEKMSAEKIERRNLVAQIDFSKKHYVVEEVFKNGGGFLIMDGQVEAWKNRFDEPEKLVYFQGALIHIRDLEKHQKRFNLTMQLIKEMGGDLKNPLAFFEKLHFNDVIKMRKELDRRMREENE